MMPKKNRPVTAAELMQRLKGDPEWARQNAEREACHSAKVAQLKAELEPEEGPLVAELAKAGHNVASVWDLVNTMTSYPKAIPVLAKYLSLAKHPVLRQGIARALAVTEARGVAGQELLQELLAKKDALGSEERWAMANALTVAADKDMADQIKSLVADPSFKDVHERLNVALKRLRVG